MDQEQKPRAHECDARGVLGSWVYGVHAQGTTRAAFRLARSLGGDVKDTYRYYIRAYEDARQKRPIKHEHGGTTDRPHRRRRGARAGRRARPRIPRRVGLPPRRVQGREGVSSEQEEHREEWSLRDHLFRRHKGQEFSTGPTDTFCAIPEPLARHAAP